MAALAGCRVAKYDKKSPQIAGLFRANFPAVKHIANNYTDYFGVFATLCVCTTWKKRYGLNGLWKVAANDQKVTHDFPTPINAMFCSMFHRLAVIRRASFCDPQFLGLWKC